MMGFQKSNYYYLVEVCFVLKFKKYRTCQNKTYKRLLLKYSIYVFCYSNLNCKSLKY